MGRGIKEIRLVPKDVLRAVSVMDIEIYDRDPFRPMRLGGMEGTDRRGVEQAKAHCTDAFGMMTGRAHRAEGVFDLASHHFINGKAPPADGA